MLEANDRNTPDGYFGVYPNPRPDLVIWGITTLILLVIGLLALIPGAFLKELFRAYFFFWFIGSIVWLCIVGVEKALKPADENAISSREKL